MILTFSVIYTHASILLGATLNLIIDNMILFPGLDFVHGTYKEEARKKKQSRRFKMFWIFSSCSRRREIVALSRESQLDAVPLLAS